MTDNLECRDIINHSLYPIDEIDNTRHAVTIDQVRSGLADEGCAVIRGFFSGDGLSALLTEAGERKAQAYYSPRKQCNI